MEVTVPVGAISLAGTLDVPAGAHGVVAFAHGSGSGRHSPRNRAVAAALRERGVGTLLCDLLTEDEEAADARSGALRFDIGLLAERVTGVVDWLRERHGTVGLFGASTGAAAALRAAAARPEAVAAVVSRGGRPDLAGDDLSAVVAPVLLIVGGADASVLSLNRDALRGLRAEAALELVPGAGHLFEEPGALDEVAALAGAWFARHLSGDGGR